jgi:GTP-binding protein
VIAANKGDLAQAMGVGPRQYEEGVKRHTEAFMKELGDIPVIATVATEGKGINRLLSTVLRVHDSWSNRISTWILNKWLKDLLVINPPPRVAGKQLSIKYMVQVKSRPPTFALFCNASGTCAIITIIIDNT